MSTGPLRYEFLVAARSLPRQGATDAWQSFLGGLDAALSPGVQRRRGAWIGWAGLADDDLERGPEPGMPLLRVRRRSDAVEAEAEGFANSTIWPLYHDHVIAPEFRRSWWESYRRSNERFAHAVVAAAAPDALVWVQDHHLQLVPEIVRAVRSDVHLGYFSHLPFPPVELFSQLPWRTAILSGILGADVIGFQRHADAENFIAACIHLRGSDPRDEGTVVGTHPVSVEADRIVALAEDAADAGEPERIRTELGDPKTVLLGVDDLDHTKGILERLLALEELFSERILDPTTTCFVQIAMPSREDAPAHRQLRADVEWTVGRLNGKFSGLSGACIHYLHRHYPLEDVIPWYLTADALLATSLRDGMNLAAKEYVAARRGRGGALVLSEFAGAADELVDALVINPHDRDGLKAAIARTVMTDEYGSNPNIDTMADIVASHSLHQWAVQFLDSLETVGTERRTATALPRRTRASGDLCSQLSSDRAAGR